MPLSPRFPDIENILIIKIMHFGRVIFMEPIIFINVFEAVKNVEKYKNNGYVVHYFYETRYF